MHLVLQPASIADIEATANTFGPEKGDLVAPALQAVWHLPEPSSSDHLEAARRRVVWSARQQADLARNDPTVHWVKVVDTDKGDEMVGLGRWHFYEKGFENYGDLEICGTKDRQTPDTWPEGLNKELLLGLLDPCFADRRKWMGEGRYWVLTTITTREPLRKHGAGSKIIEWGSAKAKQDRCPAYLEAVAAAKGLYEKHGFREIGTQVVKMDSFGMPGGELVFSRMRAEP